MSVEGPADSTGEPRRLGGRYELGAMLGHGGMAVVRRGTDLRLGRTVAVKTLRGELTEAPAFQARFRREARAAAALDHPSIVSVYDAGEETVDGVVALYIVMEYVDGQTLRDLLRTGPQTPRRTLEITADILDALAASHRAGIVHRDVKPANVMVTPSGAVKVMDFGVARAVADMSASLTQTQTVIGTAHYLSPEQARGELVDARSDVYSVGCLLYELLTGRPPFVGDSAIAVAYQQVREAPKPPSEFEPGVPPEIDAIVLAALAKQPGERYQSAAEMRRDILGVLAGEPAAMPMVPAPAETTAELQAVAAAGAPTTVGLVSPVADTADQAASGRRRRRTVGVLLAAAAVLLAIALGGFALSGLNGDPDRGQQAQQPPGRAADPSETATRQSRSDAREPSGLSTAPPDEGATDKGGADEQPRPVSDPDRRSADATDEDGGETADRDARADQPEPTQDSEPSSAPPSTSTPEETTAEETTPEETTPEETTAEETTAEESEPEPEPSPSEEPEDPATTESAEETN